MNGMKTSWLWSSGSHTQTHTHEFSPRWTHAYVALAKYAGDGTARASIRKYRYRLSSGADKTVYVSNDQPVMVHDDVTSVTFEIWSWNAMGYAVEVMTFW